MTEIQEAESLLEQGKLLDAEKRFLALANADPNNKRTFNSLGVIAFQNQDFLAAISRFMRALQIDPYYKTALVNMFQALHQIHHTEQMAGLLEQYINRYPNDAEIEPIAAHARRECLKIVANPKIVQGKYQTVGILMITKNHLPALQRSLPPLLVNTIIPYELTIFDNHSTDGTIEWLQKIEHIMPVIFRLVFNADDLGMFEPSRMYYDSCPHRYLVRVSPDARFYPGWLMEFYHKYESSAPHDRKVWLSRNTEAVHKSLSLQDDSHLNKRRDYSLFYEEQGRDVTTTRYGQERMFHLEGNPRLNFVTDCAEGDCLDIACQFAAYTIWLAKQGHRVYGVDLSASYLQEAQCRIAAEPDDVGRRITLVQSWAECLPFTERSFQTVLLSEILEHVIQPEATLAEAIRVLKPDGVLYLSVPGYADDTLEHVRIFSEESIMHLLQQHGDVLDVSSPNWYCRQPSDHFILSVRKVKSAPETHDRATRLSAFSHAAG